MAPLDHCPDPGAQATATIEMTTPSANVEALSMPDSEPSDDRNPDQGTMVTTTEENIQNVNNDPLSIPGMDPSNHHSLVSQPEVTTESRPPPETHTNLQTSLLNCTEIVRLQAALAEERLRSASFEAKLAALGASDEQNACHFLQLLPRETRDHIYSFILVSESLSNKLSVHVPSPDPHASPDEWARQQEVPIINYGLSPALLRTCRQIYEEASAVLYGNNIFYIDCGSAYRASSPIFRRDNSPMQLAADMLYPYDFNPPQRLTYSTTHDAIKSFAAVAKVRRWKVFVSSHKPLRHSKCPPAGLSCLCRAICHSALLSLDVLLIPMGRMYTSELAWTVLGHSNYELTYTKLSHVLQPLQLLRNVQSLRLIPAPAGDCRPYNVNRRRPPGIGPAQPPPIPEAEPEPVQIPFKLAAKILSVVQGNSPVVRICEMFDNLVAYAQAFERNAVYKAEMRPKYGWCEDPTRAPYAVYDRPERSFFKRARNYRSPDVHTEIHPVEARLEKASIAADRNELAEFKKHRKAVIKHLEQQYGHITSAAAVMAEMIKSEKRHGGLFGVTKARHRAPEITYELPRTMACFVVALHKYAKSFKRDLTPDMEIDIQLRAREWRHAYSMLPREQYLQKLDVLIESHTSTTYFPGSVPEWAATIKLVMDDMDKQYLEIRRLRKLLFKNDPEGVAPRWYSDEFFQPWLCDEMVNWAVNEPDMSPAPDPSIPVPTPQERRQRLRDARFPRLAAPPPAQTTPASPNSSTAATTGSATSTEADADTTGGRDDDVDSIWGDLSDLSEDQSLPHPSSATPSDAEAQS